MSSNLVYCFLCCIGLHILAWFSTNMQLMSNFSWSSKSLLIAVCFAIPCTLFAYYGTKFGYAALGESAWGARFFIHATSYLVFPFLTWWLLGESMFTVKTMVSVFLSLLIILVQIYL